MFRKKRAAGDKERYWRRLVGLWRRSGLSVRAFCRLHDLSEPSWYAWRRTLARRDAQPVRFQAVEVVGEATAVGEGGASTSGLELVLPRGRRLRVGADFDAATLQRLLAVLEEGQPC